MLNTWMLGTFLWPQTDTRNPFAPKPCSKMLPKYFLALLGGGFLVASTKRLRPCLHQDRIWLLREPGYTGLEGFWCSPSTWEPHFQVLPKLSLEVDQNHVSKAVDPSHGLTEHAAAVLADVSPDQEGEMEAWLLEQSPDFLPSV